MVFFYVGYIKYTFNTEDFNSESSIEFLRHGQTSNL